MWLQTRLIVKVLAILLQFLQYVNAAIPLPQIMEDFQPLAEVLAYVIDRHISPMTNTLNIMERCKNCGKQKFSFQTSLLEHLLANFPPSMALQFFNGEPDGKPWDYNVFIVDSLLAFEDLCTKFPHTLYEREFYILIVLTKHSSKHYDRRSLLKQMFEMLVEYRVLNVVILCRNTKDSFCFYTYEIFGPNKCHEDLEVHEVNQFADGQLQYDYLFPQLRLLNFYNCQINVSAHIIEPLLIFHGNPANMSERLEISRLTGIDGDILKVLAGALKFRIRLKFSQDLITIDNSGNATGCFRDLLEDYANIAIGGLSTSLPNRHYFSVTLTYHQTPYLFILRSGLRFSSMEQLALPFSSVVWISLFIVVALAFVILIILFAFTNSRVQEFILGPRNQQPITNLITILLGNPITMLPRRNFARFLLMAWTLATYVLRNAYQAKMFDAFRTSKRTPLPVCLHQLIERKYTLLNSRYTDFYPRNMTFIMRHLNKRYMKLETSHEKLATISLLDTLAYYNRHNMNTSSLTYVAEPIYQFQSAMFFQKHSVLRPAFDHKLQQLITSGITGQIARKHVERHFHALNTHAIRMAKISNKMLIALYMVYTILLCLAGVVFILERLSRRSSRIRSILDWLHK